MAPDAEQLPMERITYDPGGGDRFTLLIFTKNTHEPVRKYGGDPVSQARRLRAQQRKAGFVTQLIRHRPDGGRVIDSDF